MNKQMSQKGIEMLKDFEGCKLEAYQDIVKVWTIGYGHTNGVKKGQKITQLQADTFLKEDLHKFEVGVTNLLKVDVTQNQFDALVDFSYNLGLGSLQSSSLLRYVNAKKWTEASKEFAKWNHARDKVVDGLTRRRLAEAKLFLSIK